jgi:hypothetical protein
MGRFRSKYWSPWLVGAAAFAAAAGPSACAGGGASSGATQRYVDTPAWTTVEYGAPKERAYSAELTAERDIVQVVVSEKSRCDVIPVKVVERVEETVEDGAVLARRSLGTQQIAGEPTETVSCSETLARDAEVSLKIGDDVFVLGTTGRDGKVVVDLSERLRQSLYGDTVPTEGQVLVRGPKDISPATAGSIALESLRKHEQRVSDLLAELTSILDKGEAIAPADIQRSYTLYSQLEQLSPNDARVAGASARFWELFYGRKRREATATLARNMEALAKARDLLKSARVAAIPVFAQAAINAGNVDARATNWASWEVLGGLARQPAVCAQPFAWPNVASYGFDSSTLLALHYLRYAYADRAAKDVQAVCQRLK